MCSTERSISGKEASLDADSFLSDPAGRTTQSQLWSSSAANSSSSGTWQTCLTSPTAAQALTQCSHQLSFVSSTCKTQQQWGRREGQISFGIFFSPEPWFPRKAIQLLWEESTEIPSIRAHNCHSVMEIHSIPPWNQAAYKPCQSSFTLTSTCSWFLAFLSCHVQGPWKYCIEPAPCNGLLQSIQFKVTTQTKAWPQKDHNLLFSTAPFPTSQHRKHFFFPSPNLAN